MQVIFLPDAYIFVLTILLIQVQQAQEMLVYFSLPE
jgi:hypothetical protein